MIIRFLLLWGLVWLLIETDQPFLCAGIYAFAHAVFGFFAGVNFEGILISTIIAAGMAALYFWILDKLNGKGLIFWAVAFLGGAIGFL